MTIKQHGGVFGRNPSFNEVEAGDGTIKIYGDELGYQKDAVIENLEDGFLRLVSPRSIQLFSNTGEMLAKFVANGQNEFYYNNLSRFKTTVGGVEVTDGNLKFADGHGIDFSATSGTGTSELFDDYEEGTFDNSGGTLLTSAYSFVSRTGQYTKVGDTVTAWFRYEWTSTNTGSGDTILNAMPFTASNNGYVLITECNANISADQIYGTVLSGTNQIKLYGRSNASTTLFGPAQKNVWQTGGVSNILAGVAVFKT